MICGVAFHGVAELADPETVTTIVIRCVPRDQIINCIHQNAVSRTVSDNVVCDHEGAPIRMVPIKVGIDSYAAVRNVVVGNYGVITCSISSCDTYICVEYGHVMHIVA